jgi:hypothetical protein
MKKEEPAWKAGMGELIDSFLGEITSYGEVAETSDRIAEMFTARITPCILAAEQRGFQAGVNKTGDSVGKLREQLKTAEERGRQQALSALDAEIDVMLSNVPALQARTAWKSGYEGALTALSVTLDSIMPDKP